MAHDPLSPSEALRTPVGTALAVVSLLVVVYALVIVAQVLLGVIVAGGLSVGSYLGYRTVAVLDSIADAAQRIAAAREREAEEASRPSSRSTDRISERER